jgi:hypothetical protein
MEKAKATRTYKRTRARIIVPLIPRFAADTFPKEPPEKEGYRLPAELSLTGASGPPTCLREAQQEGEELLRRCRERVRRGERAAIWELLEINPAFIANAWVREQTTRFLEGGLSTGRRGRRPGTFKVHPLVIVGLVQQLIESGRARNPERAFVELDEFGLVSYDSAKDAYYRALRDSRYRPVLVELPGFAEVISEEQHEAALRRGRRLQSGDEITLVPRKPGTRLPRITIRGL